MAEEKPDTVQPTPGSEGSESETSVGSAQDNDALEARHDPQLLADIFLKQLAIAGARSRGASRSSEDKRKIN